MSEPWSRGDKIALAGVLLAAFAFFAALIVVPEIRQALGLTDEQPSPQSAAEPIREDIRPPASNTVEEQVEPDSRQPSESQASALHTAPPRTETREDPTARTMSASAHKEPTPSSDPRSASVPDSSLPAEDAQVVTIGRTGFISGLDGRLNPILDSLRRTYLYAENIAINDGKAQPVAFVIGKPFFAEDSHGNKFQLRVLSITDGAAVIEYRRLSSDTDVRRYSLDILITDQTSAPIEGVDIRVIFADGTSIRGSTNSRGKATLSGLKSRVVTIYGAHASHSAFLKEDHDAQKPAVVKMESRGNGSVIVDSTGYIPGVESRLNPILDSHNRMYLYADGAMIDNGKTQPAPFRLHVPFQIKDKNGATVDVKIIAIKARSSLLEFSNIR